LIDNITVKYGIKFLATVYFIPTRTCSDGVISAMTENGIVSCTTVEVVVSVVANDVVSASTTICPSVYVTKSNLVVAIATVALSFKGI